MLWSFWPVRSAGGDEDGLETAVRQGIRMGAPSEVVDYRGVYALTGDDYGNSRRVKRGLWPRPGRRPRHGHGFFRPEERVAW